MASVIKNINICNFQGSFEPIFLRLVFHSLLDTIFKIFSFFLNNIIIFSLLYIILYEIINKGSGRNKFCFTCFNAEINIKFVQNKKATKHTTLSLYFMAFYFLKHRKSYHNTLIISNRMIYNHLNFSRIVINKIYLM